MKIITAAELFKNLRSVDFSVLYGNEYLSGAEINTARVQRPGLALAGYFEHIRPNRVQLFGDTETAFLKTLDDRAQLQVLEKLAEINRCVFIMSNGHPACKSILSAAKRFSTPVISIRENTQIAAHEISAAIDYALAPETVVHGVCMEIFGLGVIITGKSGIGKSECALELVKKGHRLVADDVIYLKKRQHYIVGTSDEFLRNHIELRGVGILDLTDMFGILAVRRRKRVDFIIDFIDFAEWNTLEQQDRLGLLNKSKVILDIPVPMVQCPVSPGRNMAEIVELAAKNQLLKIAGHNSSEIFSKNLTERIKANERQELS